MQIPLSIVEAGKTDEYVKLQKRDAYYIELYREAYSKSSAATKELCSVASQVRHYNAGIPNGLIIELQKAAKDCLEANRKVEHLRAVRSVVENDIKQLEKEATKGME
ncbi:hypothetical protein ACSHUI_00365 [Bacillus subtilis]|uniref:hypothetical protein n=1 Tax=Bacillus subtilis TaxID=1423 RepID=UPI003CF01317